MKINRFEMVQESTAPGGDRVSSQKVLDVHPLARRPLQFDDRKGASIACGHPQLVFETLQDRSGRNVLFPGRRLRFENLESFFYRER